MIRYVRIFKVFILVFLGGEWEEPCVFVGNARKPAENCAFPRPKRPGQIGPLDPNVTMRVISGPWDRSQ